ncbi:FtsK/SpoIIIE domain-containing protein [Caballeronia sp. LZ032]|uniref:FtsK/SpoIIIE domain-containing protein n=1 Tax=Caballeronia sp. LZ032 TaxID=3038565 RepID=UPI00285C15F0|nr:FtsK/SpoIIIE domain-containing protein [Caballeronia sp. LZ032]MDR5876938.1 FtsK/SpoIIIE domain-containing protein [Caballeronia sp. LZ032]
MSKIFQAGDEHHSIEELWERVISDIRSEYLSPAQDFPWIIGFSGGKDSTLVAHLAFEALLTIPPSQRTRPVHVVSNDTLVESPFVMLHLNKVCKKIAASADDLGLPVFVGLDLDGANVSFDLRTAPHLLVGGATGMGKSVCLHTLVLSLLLGRSAETLQLALIDPKQVEFAPYSGLDNLFGGEVVPDVAGALKLLQRLVVEMDTRYATFAGLGVSDIAQALKKGAELPYVAVVVEELADLVLQSKKIEPLIVRLAQKARAAGIHLILATQRPDAKTFSGLIRSNVPARIALTVQKTSESIIVIDEAGAESLTGAGDMLVKLPGKALVRAHGPMISPQDINAVVQGRLP